MSTVWTEQSSLQATSALILSGTGTTPDPDTDPSGANRLTGDIRFDFVKHESTGGVKCESVAFCDPDQIFGKVRIEISVADPGSCAFLPPGSGIRLKFFSGSKMS
jgi:hypothetical protein